MKYEVVINRKGRRMYYATNKEGKKKLTSVDKIPAIILESLTPSAPISTNVPEPTNEMEEMRAEVGDALTDDETVATKQQERDEVKADPEDEKLLIDAEEYDNPSEATPEEPPKKVEEKPQPPKNVCFFTGEPATKVRRINMVTFYLCDEMYYTKTPGEIIEKYNKEGAKVA